MLEVVCSWYAVRYERNRNRMWKMGCRFRAKRAPEGIWNYSGIRMTFRPGNQAVIETIIKIKISRQGLL